MTHSSPLHLKIHIPQGLHLHLAAAIDFSYVLKFHKCHVHASRRRHRVQDNSIIEPESLISSTICKFSQLKTGSKAAHRQPRPLP